MQVGVNSGSSRPHPPTHPPTHTHTLTNTKRTHVVVGMQRYCTHLPSASHTRAFTRGLPSLRRAGPAPAAGIRVGFPPAGTGVRSSRRPGLVAGGQWSRRLCRPGPASRSESASESADGRQDRDPSVTRPSHAPAPGGPCAATHPHSHDGGRVTSQPAGPGTPLKPRGARAGKRRDASVAP